MKFRMIAVLLAGSVLLGGCGAGSSTAKSSDTGNDGAQQEENADAGDDAEATKKEAASVKTVSLDPSNPVSLTIWDYYNGAQQATFDEMVEEFNNTVGNEEGIYVEAYTQGSVSDLEAAVTSAMKEEVGAEKLPDIFSAYADTAYAALQNDKLVNLREYFTEDELSQYVDNYLAEGDLTGNGGLYLLPIAKSTEVTMVNLTDWGPFAQETGAQLEELETIEGITKVAEEYYNWTDAKTPDVDGDGKAFYGRDSMSNYFVIGMRQMGIEIFEAEDGVVTLHTDKEAIRRLWDNYYVPYVKGYFGAYGKFRSDDTKTGEILAYTGSIASSAYFPANVETDDGTYAIECGVVAAPVMEGGENVRVQQGAGMAVVKSDEQHEYAACRFLAWFTQKENNLQFACSASYLPVRKDSNDMEAVKAAVSEGGVQLDGKTYDCFETVMESFEQTEFYTTKCFENGYNTRKILDYNLSDQATADREAVEQQMAEGVSYEDAVAPYLTDETFESWYEQFCQALEDTALAGEKG